ncbi:MAG: 50S ribosomal protein L30 [Candidatus Rokubacteria bacterium]|nr:50S ribosomal protein L30 [Candidatus Rokubacteria bacterium]
MSDRKLKVTLLRSRIGLLPKQERTLEALGLRRIRQQVIHRDSPEIRGMLNRVGHLVRIEETA